MWHDLRAAYAEFQAQKVKQDKAINLIVQLLADVDKALRGARNGPPPTQAPGVSIIPRPPVDMILYCPACGTQHIDAPEGQFYPGMTAEESAAQNMAYGLWDNPPHKSHKCGVKACGHIWRPADVPTNGVAALKTHGKDDSPAVYPPLRMPKESDHG